LLKFFLAYLLYFGILSASFSVSALSLPSARTAVSWSSSKDRRKEAHSHYLLHRSTCRERLLRIQLASQHVLIAKRYQKTMTDVTKPEPKIL